MKWMIASDLHGSYFYASQMQQAFEREQADRLLLLGDLLYHGPRNDLPEGYAPKRVIPLLNGMKDRLLCVRGNCEAEVDQMVLEFPVLADYAVLPVGRRLVYATHGHVYNTKTPPPLAPGDILLHGHTHIPAWEPFGQGSLYLNPGSVSLPKEGSFAWEWLEGQTLLLQNQTQRQGQYILQELRSRRLHPAEILESSNIRAAAALAANGYGIGFLSGELLEHLNNAVPFNAFPLRDCTLPLESVAAWRAGNYLPRYALAFIERMEQLENQKCNNSATKAH